MSGIVKVFFFSTVTGTTYFGWITIYAVIEALIFVLPYTVGALFCVSLLPKSRLLPMVFTGSVLLVGVHYLQTSEYSPAWEYLWITSRRLLAVIIILTVPLLLTILTATLRQKLGSSSEETGQLG